MKFLKILHEIILFPFKIIAYFCIYIYKFFISPILPNVCGYYPTCSNYMIKAIKTHGLFKGGLLGIKRICHCNGKTKGGFDFVPLNIKGDIKWLV